LIQGVSSHEQLAFLQSVYNSAEIGICVTDEDGCFVLVNDAYCRTYGYDRDELVGQPFTLVLPENVRDMAATIHDEYLAGGEESAGEWQVLTKSGEIRSVMVTAARVVTDEGERFKVTTVQDISLLRAQESRLAQLSEVVAQTQHGVIFTDADGLVTWVNKGFEDMTGFSQIDALGRKPGEFLQGERTDPETVKHMSRRLAAGEGFQVEIINYAANGREYWLHIACSPVLDQSGQPKGFMALQTDITEHKNFKQRIEQLSFEDSLTGLPNRRLVEEQLKFRMGSSQRSRLYQAVLFLDLDNFKLVNDTLGLRQGDELLIRVGQTLKNNLYESDLAARLGGDEFVVVITNSDSDATNAAIGRICECTNSYNRHHPDLQVSMSLGGATATCKDEIAEALRRSDTLMYANKIARNKNR